MTGDDRHTVLLLAKTDGRHLDMIRKVDPRVEVVAAGNPERALEAAPMAEIIVAWEVPDEVVARAGRLRWIQATGAGVEKLLVPAVTEGRVILTNSVGVHLGLPDHIMGLILAFSRRLHLAVRRQIERKWDRRSTMGEEVTGQVVGVLGLGAIGRALAARAAAFDMRVIGTKRTQVAIPHVERVLPPEGTDQVLREADYLVIALPLTPSTKGLIDGRALSLMKRSAVLINIGRGQVVDEDALIDALRRGAIAGAGLDVFAREPLPSDSPLYEMENVIMTPHVAGASRTYFDRAIPLFCENLRRYLDGRTLLNVVDPARGY